MKTLKLTEIEYDFLKFKFKTELDMINAMDKEYWKDSKSKKLIKSILIKLNKG